MVIFVELSLVVLLGERYVLSLATGRFNDILIREEIKLPVRQLPRDLFPTLVLLPSLFKDLAATESQIH